MTATSCQHPFLINVRTSKNANMPGPAMFHLKQERKDFLHFSHALIERNESFENLNFVGGDRSSAQRGFLKPLKYSTFLPCTMHMQDDIKMFLKENLLGNITDEVISDIFGSDNNKVKGLIDSTKDTFKATCDALCKKWDTSEKTIHPEKNTLFSSYFRQNIAADIENGMLTEIREYLGLDNGFYFNNAQECSN